MLRPKGKTLAQVLEEKAASSATSPAIFFQDMVIDYHELLQRSERAANSLLAAGVRGGDRVGVILGNEPDWVVLAMAASMLGVTFVPCNTWYKKSELAWMLRHSGVSLLVAASTYLKTDYAALFAELIPELATSYPGELRSAQFPQLKSVVFRGPGPQGSLSWDGFLRAGLKTAANELKASRAAVLPDSPAFVLYTSGSTAEPKGVLLNHRGVVENGFELGHRRSIVAADRVWLGTPLFYGLGATNALPATITAGAALVLQAHFEAGSAIACIRDSGATVYYATGNITRAILDHPDYSQAKIGTLQKGNAGTMPEYKRLTLREMRIAGAVPAYGLTETYGNATVGFPDDPVEVKIETNGTPLPGMEIRIVDPGDGKPLPAGQTGLVLIKGHITPGYLHNPGETNKALRPDGFFDSGDLGSVDAAGRLIFHSRLKEVIKSGGINISPAEVEQLLASHPDVRDAFVVGVSDATRGELVVAFVDAAAPISEQALREFVKERAAAFKVPHHVFFRTEEQLPRLSSGKIAKYRLAEEARSELGR